MIAHYASERLLTCHAGDDGLFWHRTEELFAGQGAMLFQALPLRSSHQLPDVLSPLFEGILPVEAPEADPGI